MNMLWPTWVNRSFLDYTQARKNAFLVTAATWFGISTLFAQDVGFIGLLKGQHFEQTASGLVTLLQDNERGQSPFLFTAMIAPMGPDLLSNTILEFPDDSTTSLSYNPEDGVIEDEYLCESLLELEQGRPSGEYTFSFMATNDGPCSVTLSLTGDAYPAAPPVVTNFTALQSITNTAEAITIQWSAIPGATADDYIQLSIEGPNGMQWQTGSFGAPNALCGTNTSVTLPPNTLSAGQTYDVELMVARGVDFDFTITTAIAAYYVRTDFKMHTTPLYASFESAIPANSAFDVPRNSVIGFRFSAPMNPGFMSINWSGTGLNPESFSYSWSDGRRVLLCAYAGALPSSCDVAWTLNLSGFKDAFGHTLSGTVNGSFRTGSDAPLTGDWARGFLMKTRYYQQTGATPESVGLFDAEASVEMTAFNRVKLPASVTVSNQVYTLSAEEWDPELLLETSYPSQAQLDTYFPNGAYTFSLPQLSGGTNTFTLDLGPVDDYPPAPTITNLVSLQSINSSNDTVIAWPTLSNFSPWPEEGSRVIEAYISDDQGGEDMYAFEPGDINITASGITIPANTLWPGRTYEVTLIFTSIKDWNYTDQDHFSAAGFSTTTCFMIHTAGTPIMPKMNISSATLGTMEVSLEGGEPNRHYVVETSRDLQRWIPQFEVWTDSFASMMSQQDPDAQYLPSRFYRLRDWVSTDGWVQPPISIQGTVWTDASHTTPLAGAQVGTSLDGQVTITDKNGRFFLETGTVHNGVGLFYMITVSKEAQSRSFGPWEWGHSPREQVFEMNSPE